MAREQEGRPQFLNAAQILRRLEADAFPAIGQRPIAALEPPEQLDMLRKVEKRGVNETARRLKQLVGQISRFAKVTGRAKRDPSVDLTASQSDAALEAANVLEEVGELQRRTADQTCIEAGNPDVSSND